MTHPERTALEDYAVDPGASDHADVERHLADCTDCAVLALRFGIEARKLRDSLFRSPPADLAGQILFQNTPRRPNPFVSIAAAAPHFDVVLCEGVIPMQHEPQAFLRHVAGFAAPGGVVVTTCMDSVSQFAEIMRRLVGALAVAPEQSTEEKLERLRPVFEPHLATLAGRSRLVDDWILDVVIQPWVGSMLSIADAIEALDSAFDVYGSSPQFFTDWRWYKDIHGEARRFNQNAIAAFYRNLHNLIDYRHTWAPRAPEANRELLALCDSIFELERRFESEPENGAISDIAAELRRLRALTAEFSPATAEAIGDLIAALETLGSYGGSYGGSSGDLPSLGGFAPLFGRGQQYLSFIRR